jgi:environmental stress-induced protein Ves
MSYRHFPANSYQTMPWKNGGGSTSEIFRYPENQDVWQWRISVAEVASNGAFSLFPGCQRSLTLLSGAGMLLHFENRTVELLPPHASVYFSGEEQLSAELIDNATTDFNVIWQNNTHHVTVERRAMLGALWFIPEKNVSWFIYFISGHGSIKSEPNGPEIQTGDSIWLCPNESTQRMILEAYGEALWVKISEI